MMHYLLAISLFFLPAYTYAADPTFKQVVGGILEFNQLLVIAIFTLTFLVIVWKIVDAWILKGGDPGAIEKGKKTLIVGILVLVVMSGLWGIIEILNNSFSGVLDGSNAQTEDPFNDALNSTTSI